jgi:Holliday junction resolvase
MVKKTTYDIGRQAELKVARDLKKAGAKVELSPGSRGAADIRATFPGKKWDVQVKAGTNPPTSLNGVDKQRLNQKATKSGTTPVLAIVKDNKIEYRSTRCNRKLTP